MSELLGRVRAAFIAADAPRAARPVVHEALAEPAPHAAVVCDLGVASVAGAALALRLASATGASAAVVCRWQADPAATPVGGSPARPAARRLVARLAARDVAARAVGRLVLATLEPDPEAALGGANRALAAAGAAGAPAVVVLAGARPAALDALLAEREAIVVLTAPDAGALAEAAAAGAADLGPPVFACALRARPLERMLAAAGIVAVGGLARALEPACRAVA